VQLDGFSAHADRDELLRWISALRQSPRRLFVTHGESNVTKKFAEFLKGKTGWDISVPEYLDQVVLE